MYINPKVQALPSRSFLPQHRSQILKLLASLSLCDSENMPNPSQVTLGQLPTFSLPCQDQMQHLVEGAGAPVTKAQRPTTLPDRNRCHPGLASLVGRWMEVLFLALSFTPPPRGRPCHYLHLANTVCSVPPFGESYITAG